MRNTKLLLPIFCLLTFGLSASNAPKKTKPNPTATSSYFSSDCAQAIKQTDLDVNNVRARLLVGGDMWWDGNQGGYIVPNVEPGEEEISSIFAGALWVGGFDPGGNLKVAAQTYGTSSGASDYWPGPLSEVGSTQADDCKNWDIFFSVTSTEIDLHLELYEKAQKENVPYDVSQIPRGVLEWPGLGNEFFFDIFGFELPSEPQGLAPFWDENADGVYTPQFGDHPMFDIRGKGFPLYADEMKFWIFNDAGNIHTESAGGALQMEVQAQAFAFATDDAFNNMTFTSYKLINRAQESIENTFLGIWLDPQLGCGHDDYIGCDTTRNLMYIYNKNAVDGDDGSACLTGTPTYGDKVPYLGVDLFKGPLASRIVGENGEFINPELGQEADTIVELGMTSFIYYTSPSGIFNPSMSGPTIATHYYNYLSGTWRNGAPMTVGGNGLGGTKTTKFAFSGEPNDDDAWSMCSEGIQIGSFNTVQATGPFRLEPGRMNEMIIGIPWVPDVQYPCPDMGRLFRADDLAQCLFSNCFEHIDGPDAPDLSWIPQDQKVIGVLSNEGPNSNNKWESYSEISPCSDPNFPSDERKYNFEGYLVYQLADQDVTKEELDDPEKARIAFQTDKENNATDIYNWEKVKLPNTGPLDNPYTYRPVLQVEGENQGLETTFELTTDLFTGDPLVNYKPYYFMTKAYAYNEFLPFDPKTERGQATPYIEGNGNIKVYTVIPRETTATIEAQLDKISVFPNPIVSSLNAGASFSETAKIINLPPNSDISIFTLDGQFIRKFRVDEDLQTSQQPALDWDMTSSSGTPVASGIYLIYIQVEGLGERVLKLVHVK